MKGVWPGLVHWGFTAVKFEVFMGGGVGWNSSVSKTDMSGWVFIFDLMCPSKFLTLQCLPEADFGPKVAYFDKNLIDYLWYVRSQTDWSILTLMGPWFVAQLMTLGWILDWSFFGATLKIPLRLSLVKNHKLVFLGLDWMRLTIALAVFQIPYFL